MRDTVADFLGKNDFSIQTIEVDAILDHFQRDMTAGLRGEPASLAMIPAYIGIDHPVPVGKPVIVLDAGGTNLRTAVLTFDAAGKPTIGKFSKFAMPGTQGTRATARMFYDALTAFLAPVLAEARSIGFCFSYPADITPDCDARLIRWTKQVDIPELVGAMVGGGLRDALAERGYHVDITILNDTVATLLAGKSSGLLRRYSNYVGFILGTGTNTAYVARNADIRKAPGLDPAGAMAINVESGNFNGVPLSTFDRLFDATTADPGVGTFEKKISGAYIGGLGLVVLQCAAREGFFSKAAADELLACDNLPNKDLDDFCDNPFIPTGVLSDMSFTDDDRRLIMELCTPVYERAALLTAINISAAVLQTGSGEDPLHPVCVTIDGSTYYRTKTAHLKSRVESHLRDILGSRNIHYELINIDDAPMIGAAVAGLTR